MVKSAYSSGQAIVRRRRGQRAGDHRSRRGHQGRRGQDRHGRGVRQRHHLLARAVRARAAKRTTTRRVKLFKDTGKVWFTDDEQQMQKLREVVFPDGHLNKDVVGKSAREIGAMAGHRRSRRARGSSCCRRRARARTTCSRRRSSARSWRSCRTRRSTRPLPKAKANLLVEGAGHSAALHSNNEGNIREAGLELPVSRARRQPGELADGRRFADERLRADDDARLRLVGRQFDLREPRLQAPDERVAHRQGHREQEGADGRGNLRLVR